MGLDMYAYRLKESLAPQELINVNLLPSVLKHYDFEMPPDEWAELMAEEEVKAIREKVSAIRQKAVEDGLLDLKFDYWRKFNHLHGWMKRLYEERGGDGPFNCVVIRLREEDLDRLLKEAKGLTPTRGLFFGDTAPMNREDCEEVRSFVKKAKAAIAEGYAVYYDSWW